VSPSTHTYAILHVSEATYEEISKKLELAGYSDQFHIGPHGEIEIDMHGLALRKETRPAACAITFRGKRK
jgi:hypothetical protein